MRESRTFAERTQVLHSKEALKKYFLVYEGSETELQYFDAINSMRASLGINPLIELVPIVRSYSEKGWSNPQKILNRVIENLEENEDGSPSYETLLNRIMDYLYESHMITTSKTQAKTIWKKMIWICENKLCKSLQTEVGDFEQECKTILELLQTEYEPINIVADISEILKAGEITYSEGFDKICLIVDRDRESFIAKPENNQFEYVFEKCIEKGFGFYISNPCFEFWLLLHFEEVFALKMEELLKNPKITAKRRYAEQELRRIWPGYSKSTYRAEELVKKVDIAIENEKHFCEDSQKLEYEVGCNIGLLITEMRKV